MKRTLFYLPFIYWLITVVLLILPGNEFPKAKFFEFDGLDKIIHTIMFFILTFLFCGFFYKLNYNHKQLKGLFLQVTLYAIIYGVAMEFVQKYLVSFRSFEMADIVADTLGALAGYLVSIRVFLNTKAV